MSALDAAMIGTGLFAIAILWTAIRSKPRTSIDSASKDKRQVEAEGPWAVGGGADRTFHNHGDSHDRQ